MPARGCTMLFFLLLVRYLQASPLPGRMSCDIAGLLLNFRDTSFLKYNYPKRHSLEIDYAYFSRIIPLRKDLMSIQG